MTIRRILKRYTSLNKLSYFMNIAFGASLLMITIQFQFGRTVITTPDAIVNLDHGYITEANQIVRIVEGLLSIGLIALGIERLKHGNGR